MPWPFSTFSRWLTDRIDERISARRRLEQKLAEDVARKNAVPKGHRALLDFTIAAIRDASAVQAGAKLKIEHGLEASKHGLSLERVPFDRDQPITDFYGAPPPVGELFADVIAVEHGGVVFATGTRLPDNVLSYVCRFRVQAPAAKALALALLRAAEISGRCANSGTRPVTGSVVPGPTSSPPPQQAHRGAQ